jgi:hypothetical protein
MDYIFRKAQTVIIWLSEPAGQSDLAFEFINKICVQELDGLTTALRSGKSWRALATLIERLWFSRRWIL